MGNITRQILTHSAITSSSSANTVEAYIKDFVTPRVFARFFDENGGYDFTGFGGLTDNTNIINVVFFKILSGMTHAIYTNIINQD
jgi:hypothetical protein